MHKVCFIWPQNVTQKKTHSPHVDVAISKIASIQDDRLERDVCFVSGHMAATDRHDVLREFSVGVFPILLSLSTALVPQLH